MPSHDRPEQHDHAQPGTAIVIRQVIYRNTSTPFAKFATKPLAPLLAWS